MRGLPSCGKTTRAKELVQAGGTLIEFDAYFYTEVGEDPARYDWSTELLDQARTWNMQRIQTAVERRDALVVLDDNNALGRTTRFAAQLAHRAGYAIEFAEPNSPWWSSIRGLLADREKNREALQTWAQKLALLSRGTHRVSTGSFQRRMRAWRNDLSIEQLLASVPTPTSPPSCV